MTDAEILALLVRLGRRFLHEAQRLDPTDPDLHEMAEALDACDQAVKELHQLEQEKRGF
jgi:hypothetical protein